MIFLYQPNINLQNFYLAQQFFASKVFDVQSITFITHLIIWHGKLINVLANQLCQRLLTSPFIIADVSIQFLSRLAENMYILVYYKNECVF